jgi:hypothetical protein
MIDPTPPAITTPPTALPISLCQVSERPMVLTCWRAWLSDDIRIIMLRRLPQQLCWVLSDSIHSFRGVFVKAISDEEWMVYPKMLWAM